MSDRLNRVFGRPQGRTDSGREMMTVSDWTPTVDISETDREYTIKMELPDQGERRQEREDKGKKYHRVERSYGAFARRFSLPGEVEESKVSAEFRDGMLNLRLPKTEKAKPKAIEVKVG